MEREIVKREQGMLSVASTTRCMSCGQVAPHGGHMHTSARPHPISAGNGIGSSHASGTPLPTTAMEDAATQSTLAHSSRHAHGNNMQYSISQVEAVHSLLAGQAGLKPIHLQHAPLQPVKDPYQAPPAQLSTNVSTSVSAPGGMGFHSDQAMSRASTSQAGSMNKHRSKADKIPEPVYRKARMSQHMKEMVKVTAQTFQHHGFDAGNPLYVLDTTTDAQPASKSAGSMLRSSSLVMDDEIPLYYPFIDTRQPLSLSLSSLPKSAAPNIGKDVSTASAAPLAGRRLIGNVVLPDIHATPSSSTGGVARSGGIGEVMVSSAKLHTSYA
jgi:hypothetical protein